MKINELRNLILDNAYVVVIHRIMTDTFDRIKVDYATESNTFREALWQLDRLMCADHEVTSIVTNGDGIIEIAVKDYTVPEIR